VSTPGGERVEIKNIGSTLELERALKYELLRQRKILETGGRIKRETRHWDPLRGATKPLRLKEEEKEYLYFPEPDIPPIETRELVEEARKLASESPWDHFERLVSNGIRREHAWSIIQSKCSLEILYKSISMGGEPRIIARILAVDLRGELRKHGRSPHDPRAWPNPTVLAHLAMLVASGLITYDDLKLRILPRLARDPSIDVDVLLPRKRADPRELAEKAVRAAPKAVKDYINGKKEALDHLVGVAQRIAGELSVDPRIVRSEIMKIIEGHASARLGDGPMASEKRGGR